jgi:hypothetical protein
MSSDDGNFFSTDDDYYDWRDRLNEVILIASRRISLALLSIGLAMAGASLMHEAHTSGYGLVILIASGAFAIWAAAANIFGTRSIH